MAHYRTGRIAVTATRHPWRRPTRREFLQRTTLAAGAAIVAPGLPSASAQTEKASWTNWSGSVSCNPAVVEAPKTAKEVVAILQRASAAGSTVRTAGSGHSFTPLCRSNEVLVSTDNLRGVLSTDLAKREAVVLGGTKLFEMHEPLRAAGLAMENMGDIDRQAIAGAIATGTHGTGKGLRSISNQVVGLTIATADGSIVDCSDEADRELFKAAQVGLGALGVVLEVRMRLLPAYRLHEKLWRAPFDDVFAKLDEHIASNRHFEFFWVSQGDVCSVKTLHPTERAPDPLDGLEGERIDHSDRIFPSIRSRKFNEIEFSVPEEHGPGCLLELRELMMTKHTDIVMPLEYRTVGADDIPLSTAYDRETVTISAHQLAQESHEAFFADCEAVFRNHNGRPHWGKMHTHTPADLEAQYPKWNDFHDVRRRIDPERRLMNDYLRALFG